MRRLSVHSAEQTFCSQAANTAKGSGKASLRSRFCCGDANALTNGLASGAMRGWIWPMRASHESALSIGLGEMRTLVRSSVFEVSQNTRMQRKYWASVDGVKSLSEAS